MKNIMTKIGLVIASAALVAAIALGALYALRPRQDKTESLYVPVEVQGSGIVDGAGNELESGKAYKMPTSVVYTATTAESQTASEGITLTVKVTPANAADKSVNYTVSWKNASSTWAKNKTVTDYVTVTPQSDGSTTSTLKCLQAFGEQVIVTATSRQNPKIATTCTVDYAQRVTGLTLEIGNHDITNFHTMNISIGLGAGDSTIGGVVKANYQLSSDVFTVARTFTQKVTIDASKISWNYQSGGQNYSVRFGENCGNLENVIGRSIYYNTIFDTFDFTVYRAGQKYSTFRNMTNEQIKAAFDQKTSAITLFDIVHTVTDNAGAEYSVRRTYNLYQCAIAPVEVSALEFEKQNVVM